MVKYALKIFEKNLQLMLDISQVIKIVKNTCKSHESVVKYQCCE